MIRYTLSCERGHEFESWFANSSAYDKQAKRGLVHHCWRWHPLILKLL